MATAGDMTSIMTMTSGMTATIITGKPFVAGTLNMRATYLQDSPRKTACLPDSKGN